MLILAKITRSAAGGYAEYLEGKARASELGDYYLKDGERVEAPGRWVQGADQFGLDPARAVSAEQLHTLMDVRRPDTGQPLRRAGGSGEAVSAIDATFSAPKSVSAVWALAGPELRTAVEQAHETAIDRALTYATEQVPMLRRRVSADSVLHEKATGLIATSWRHSTARAVAEQVPDPQLHSHVLLHGAVRRDGAVAAIDSRAWLVHQREVGAAYRTELAREMGALGFGIERGTGRGGRYFEIAGVPQPLVDRWSSRHHQVQTAIRERLADRERELRDAVSVGGPKAADAATQLQALAESGLSPAQERMMGTITRSAKLPVTAQDLDSEWQRTAATTGFSRERVEVLRRAAGSELTPASERELLDSLTELDATFPAREARAIALERSAGVPIADAMERLVELRDAEQILVLADGNGTTRAQRGKERTVVAVAERLIAERVEPLAAGLAESEAQRLDHELTHVGGRLSDEQREAIMLASSDRQLVIIEGQAGTGKSTTLTGIARAHQAAGREIIVTSTAALAAERLSSDLRDAGVRSAAYSTQALSAGVASGRVRLGPETTVIHDEAALASTNEQLAVFDAVEHAGARLIIVGDPRQNQPVGAGGLWEQTETLARDAGAHVELTVNQRALDAADRRDQALFREGHAERAIRGYAARGHIQFETEQRRAEDRALEAAHQDRAAGLDTTVIAQTSNEHLDALNARAQAIRIQAGELGEPGVAVPGRPYELHEGDEVQIRRTLVRAWGGTLRNGTSASVLGVDRERETVNLEVGEDVLLLSRQEVENADLRLAYVQHPFPAQGRTTDTAHLVVTDHTTREGAYVGLTRPRRRTDIYAAEPASQHEGDDRLQELAGSMSRTEPDMASIAVPLAHEAQIPQTAARGTPESLERSTPAPPERDDEPTVGPSEPVAPASAERGTAEAFAYGSGVPAEADALGVSVREIGSSEGTAGSRAVALPELGRADPRWPRSGSGNSTTRERGAIHEVDRPHGYEP